MRSDYDGYTDEYHRPTTQIDIGQEGATYVRSITGFDGWARPLTISKSNTLGASKSEATYYHDNLSKWVLGQVQAVVDTTNPAQPVTTEYHSYDATTALRIADYAFGLYTDGYDHNPDGTVWHHYKPSQESGKFDATTYSNYKRGIPQLVQYPDGSSESALVDDLGRITSHTNGAGTTTGYGYDSMGRLARITPPLEADLTPHPTVITTSQVAGVEYGLPAGHWRQIQTQGNAVTERYYDGLWRPVLETRYDAANRGATERAVQTRWDHENRPTFTSYPQRSIGAYNSAVDGSWSSYDALGRPSQSTSNSELGNLTTTTTYLTGNRVAVKTPRGHTTTTYQAFDQPEQTAPTLIQAPEGATTTIARDRWGKAQSITRSGSYSGVAVSHTRRYVYDAYQRLCKTQAGDTNATVYGYDLAGNPEWTVEGQSLPDPAGCNYAEVANQGGSKTVRTHDNMGRLVLTTYGDASPSVSRTYWGDGQPRQIKTNNGYTLDYSYNNRRQLTQETLSVANGTVNTSYTLARHWNAHGHPDSLAYPGGSPLDLAPTALGQPTRIGGYATGASYHPNGQLAGFTYGNTTVHTQGINTRGWPSNWWHSGIIFTSHIGYDQSGNVTAINDDVGTSRAMGYDGLERLTSANGVWGSGLYGYDPLDNLRSAQVGSRNQRFVRNSRNLIGAIQNVGGASTALTSDRFGQLTNKGSNAYGWNLAHQITSTAGNTYRYDGNGRRVWNVTAGQWQVDFYSLGGQLVFSQHQSKGSTAYIQLGGKTIAEQNSSTGTSYLHTDHLGSPVAKTNAAKAITHRYRWEPYGASMDGTPSGIGYTGHLSDATGLVYMQQRYMDPGLGRFLSPDPQATDTKSAGNFNRFNYANNNPYKFRDPDGKKGVAFTFGGDLTVLRGGSAGSGGYFALDTQKSGALTYVGKTYGLSTAFAASATFFAGSGTSLLQGDATNYNISALALNLSVSFSKNANDGIFGITAITVGVGAGLPIGATVSETKTTIQSEGQFSTSSLFEGMPSPQARTPFPPSPRFREPGWFDRYSF